jgi:hypothetical protein
MNTGYIYIIKSKKTDFVYIGSTKNNIKKRFSSHKTEYKSGRSHCSSKDILKYDDACCELLETFKYDDIKELLSREAEIIQSKKYKCCNFEMSNGENSSPKHGILENVLNKIKSMVYFDGDVNDLHKKMLLNKIEEIRDDDIASKYLEKERTFHMYSVLKKEREESHINMNINIENMIKEFCNKINLKRAKKKIQNKRLCIIMRK